MIKRIILLSPLMLLFLPGMSQSDTCLNCWVNPLPHLQSRKSCCNDQQPVSSAIRNMMVKREANYNFHRMMRTIQDPSTVTSFASWTINNLGYDKKNFVLDADVQIPISIGGKNFGLNEIQVIPRFQVRIFRDDPNVPYGPQGDISLPVRTPSTMPGIAYYRSFRNWWRPENVHNKFIGIYAYHHSNGQDGPELTLTNGQQQVNVYNGNFSENVVFEFMIGGIVNLVSNMNPFADSRNKKIVKNNKKDAHDFIRVSNEKEFYWKLSYEYHPDALSNKIFDSLQMLGHNRLNLRFGLLFVPTLLEVLGDGNVWCTIVPQRRYERWRITGNISYILDGQYYRGDDVQKMQKINFFNFNRRLNFSLSGFRVIGHSGNAAFFGQVGYYGSDPYNIYFNQSLWVFKLGLAFAFFDQPDEKDYF